MRESTVKTHLSRIYRKLGLGNRTELAAFVTARADGGRPVRQSHAGAASNRQ